MLVPINNIGEFGVVKDRSEYDLPLNAWTDARNVDFFDGLARKTRGHSNVLDAPSQIPYALFPAPTATGNYWVAASTAKVFAFKGGIQADITRASGDYTGTEFNLWNGGLFNGIPVLNNGVDAPQAWTPISLSQVLTELPAWPAAVLVKVLRPFKNFLVGLGVTKGGTLDRRLIKWSHSASPGTLPTTWDETDMTKDAGEFPLSEGEDALVDCVTLGDTNVVYLESSCWGMRLSGTGSIFYFNKLFDTLGLLTQNCAKPFKGRRHFAVTADDIVVHDGSAAESIVDARLRKWIFKNLTSSAYTISFVVPFYKRQEMWFCFPYGGGGLVNMAAVWNWQYNTWTLRDLPDIRAAVSSLYGPQASAVDLYDYTSGTFDSDSGAIDNPNASPSAEAFILCPTDLSAVLQMDEGFQANGSNYNSYLERSGLAVVGADSEGRPVTDLFGNKMITSVYPNIVAPKGARFTVSVGCHESFEDPVTWVQSKRFVVGYDKKVDLYASGRLLAVRFESDWGVDWKMGSYGVDVVRLGAL